MAERLKQAKRVAICHPDLGLGGAERLIVDAAVELAQHGCHVDVYTAYHDPGRCFEETRTGEWFRVIVRGSWFPRTIFGRAIALCAYIRCAIVAMYIVYFSRQYDVVLMDQVAAAILPIRLFAPRLGVVFYCHFPDLLLSTARKSWIKRLYRYPLDWIEETTTGLADVILVNSQFTREIFYNTFRTLAKKNVKVKVLYPAVAIPPENPFPKLKSSEEPATFLSINRFERKKNIALAVEALRIVHDAMQKGAKGPLPRLVIAGGYDKRLVENREYFETLQNLVQSTQLTEFVTFVPSFTDKQRRELLSECIAVLYTPENEHFGIVPLEAMVAGRPVIACNSGGPLESVDHGNTGYICEPTPLSFSAAMRQCLDMQHSKEMGLKARQHVIQKFSRGSFGDNLFRVLCTKGESDN